MMKLAKETLHLLINMCNYVIRVALLALIKTAKLHLYFKITYLEVFNLKKKKWLQCNTTAFPSLSANGCVNMEVTAGGYLLTFQSSNTQMALQKVLTGNVSAPYAPEFLNLILAKLAAVCQDGRYRNERSHRLRRQTVLSNVCCNFLQCPVSIWSERLKLCLAVWISDISAVEMLSHAA